MTTEDMEANLLKALDEFIQGARLMPVDLRVLLLKQLAVQLNTVARLAIDLGRREEAR